MAALGSLAFGTACGVRATPPRQPLAATAKETRVVAFDAFPIFDPRPVEARLRHHLGSSSGSFLKIWRARQFEYTWWLAAAGQYVDFWEVTLRSLRFANLMAEPRLSPAALTDVAETYWHLPAWPDVMNALQRLTDHGFRTALLSNFTAPMLRSCLRSSGLEKVAPVLLSADFARSFKPAPAVYRLAMSHFEVRKEDVIFVAFAPWDALGASWFGYKTVWLNRASLTPEELDPRVPQMASLKALVDTLITKSYQ